jgi:hypothetical protein
LSVRASVAISTVAATLTILAAAILAARIFAATKLPAGMFTPFKFMTVLAVTVSHAGIFASKFWSVLAMTVPTQATIALMVWAGGGT